MNELCDHIVSAPVVVLTGAGASVPLGKPSTIEFAQQVDGELARDHAEVWHWLMASCREVWGTETVDVEMILEQVRAVLDGTDTALRDYNLRPLLQDVEPVRDRYRRIESRICQVVVDEYGEVDPAKAKALYEPMFSALWAQAGLETLPMFTLNYDVAIERAATRLGLRLVDGIRRGGPLVSPWSEAEFRTYVPSRGLTVVLFKLHGSTTWAWANDRSLVEVPLGTGKDPGSLRHALLYPYLTQKDLEREPFKTGYAYLEACLAKARVLLIMGTSLRDRHLVQILREAVVTNRGLNVVLLDPSLDYDRLVEIVGVGPGHTVNLEAGFTPETSGELVSFVLTSLRPKRRRRKVAASAGATSRAAAGP